MTREFITDQVATRALTCQSLEEIEDTPSADTVRERILSVRFDCTPNWGIDGTVDANNEAKYLNNWYRLDERIGLRADARIANINNNALENLVNVAAGDLIDDQNVNVAGFSVYGSYLYRESEHPPEDLDLLIIVDGVKGVALDALRYRVKDIKDVLIDRTRHAPRTADVGLTVLSVDQINPKNKSMLMTDAALLDISTTYSFGRQIAAPTLPPFISIMNAQKLVGWGMSLIFDKPTSTANRLDEALRMRQLVRKNHPEINLRDFSAGDYMPNSQELLAGVSTDALVRLGSTVLRLLEDDEMTIRHYAADCYA